MDQNFIYEKNLKVLEKKRPELLSHLNAILKQDQTQVRILKARSSDVTAVVKKDANSREVLLHSLTDPWAEAVTLADGINIKNGEFRCLMGMGLGYLPIELFRRELPLTVFLIVVASPRIFEAALKNMDLTQLLESDRVIFFIGNEKISVQPFQLHGLAIVSHGLSITTYEPEREIFSDFYKNVSLSIAEFGNTILSELISLKDLGKFTFENIMSNSTIIFKSVNIDVLKNCAEGMPAVIIGAGPSLSDAIPVLKRFSNRAFLIAVDSALPVLLEHEICPHLVVSVDYSPECFEKIRSIIDKTYQIPLCYPSAVNPLIAKLYRSPVKFFISSPDGFLQKLWTPLNSWANMPPMQGVAHFAFYIAAASCASPVILVGFDLAYTNFSSHAEGMKVPVTINLDTAPWIEGIDGNLLPTMKQMYGTRGILQLLIKSYGIKCFNANKRGAFIEGAPLCDLEKVLSSVEYIGKDLAAIIKARFEDAKRINKPMAVSMLKNFINNIKKLQEDTNKVNFLFNKVLQLLEKDLFINQQMEHNNSISFNKALKAYDNVNKAIAAGHFAEMFNLIKGELMDLKIENNRLDTDLKGMILKDKILFEINLSQKEIKIKENGLKEMKDRLTKLYHRLVIEKQLKDKLNNTQTSFERMRLFRELGANFIGYEDALQAEEVLREALKIVNDDVDSIILLSKALIMQLRYKEAMQLIEKSSSFTDNELLIQKFKENEKKWIERNLSEAYRHIYTVATFINLPLGIIYCKDILDCYPDHEEAKRLLEEAQKKLISYEQETSRIADMIKGDEISAINRIDNLLDENQEEFAERVLKILLKKYPDSALVRERLALLNIQKGDKSFAKNLLIQAISLAPLRPDAKIHLGALYAEEGDLKEARNYILEAFKIDVNRFAFLNETLGDLNLELGCYEEAILHYEKFFLGYPDRKDILKRMGNCYHRIGQISSAKAAWEAAER